MLKYLHIKNVAVLSSLELEFEPGFTVITGETGTGKSVLLRSIGLLLADRANMDMVRSGADKAVIEGEFDISSLPAIRAILEEKGLSGDDQNLLLVRRQISSHPRIWINNMVASLADLAEITAGLMEVSGQHEHQLLTKKENHIELLDRYADLTNAATLYAEEFAKLKALFKQKQQFTAALEKRAQLLEDINYSIDEIEAAGLKAGEDEKLEEERNKLNNIVRLAALLGSAESAVYSGEVAAIDRLSIASTALRQAGALDQTLIPLAETLNGLEAQLSDVAHDLAHYLAHLEENPERLEELEERLELIRRLKRKYGATIQDILKKLDNLQQERENLENSGTSLLHLDEAISAQGEKTLALAKKLSQARQKAAKELTKALLKELADLGLSKARLELLFTPYRLSDLPKEYAMLGPKGLEQAEFLFSANPGQELKELAKIASGGELSRVMLAFKVVLADKDAAAAYLFDEVDTGVGGALGEAIGRKIAAISAHKQAITITHLPQLAAAAGQHLFLIKKIEGDTTNTYAKKLTYEERVGEIARMLDGEKVTETGREHARTLLAACRS